MHIGRFILRAAQCKRIGSVMAALCLMWASPSLAHDFWIEPIKFQAPAGTTVPLMLRVGQDFKGDPALYLPEQFERYVVAVNGAQQPVAGKLGDDPAGSIVVGN